MKRSRQKHAFNEAKFKILSFMFESGKHFAPEEIAQELDMTPGSIRTRLSKMHFQKYIWRKKEYRNRKNPYCYGFIKQKGLRVLLGTDRYIGLKERMEIHRITGDPVDLNIKKELDSELLRKYYRLRKAAN